jgi:diacylglycerol kinase (ATP)
MKALLLYSHLSGHRDFSRELSRVQKELAPIFETLDIVCTFSLEEASRLEQEAGEKYDALLIAGGDGTFNNAVNNLMKVCKTPVLGYLNFGTIGDVGKNFGIHGGLSNALEIIKRGHIESFDVGEANGMYFAYTCAIGRYSDIAYATPRHEKRRHGKMAYYREAIRQAFEKKNIHYEVTVEGKKIEGTTSFVMVLNGKNMGGFRVNKKGNITDGKMELFIADDGPFNGLTHYVSHQKLLVISSDRFSIKTSEEGPWCLDGEKGPEGQVLISCHPKALRIFSKKIN